MASWQRFLMVLCGTVAVCCSSPLSSAFAGGVTGSLELSSSGLSSGLKASVVLSSHGKKKSINFTENKALQIPPGRYSIVVKPVKAKRSARGVRTGATAYPERTRLAVTVERGQRANLAIRYRAVINPGVRPLPSRILKILGNSADPPGLVLPGRGKVPTIGTIFTSAPSSRLPRGMISKVTRVKRERAGIQVSLKAVPATDAVPNLEFNGELSLQPAPTDPIARASASPCSPPKLNKFKAHMDSFELREASLSTWPPQMRLTLAIRTTESMGFGLAAAGINCDWTIAELGPFQGAIPVGPIVIPVYATVPAKVGAHINGRLDLATVNIASTVVASVAAGSNENRASLSLRGTNVWSSGALALSGSAKLYASVGVQAGIGVAKVSNVHVELGFGPEFEWSSGHGCGVYANLGSLSAGVSVLGKSFDTPRFTPLRPQLWSGCGAGTPGGGSGPRGSGPGGGGSGPGGGGENPPPSGGEESGNGERRGLIDTYTNGEWTSVPAPAAISEGGATFGLWQPACGSTVCVVTGTGTHNGQKMASISTLQAGTWNQLDAPQPSGANIPRGLEIGPPACALVDVCVAGANSGNTGVLETYSGGAWTTSEIPVPISGDVIFSYLESTGLACSASGICVANGSYANGSGTEGGLMVLAYENGSWSDESVPAPIAAEPDSSRVTSRFACSNGDTCIAQGHYVGGDVGFDSIIEHEGGAWSAIPVPVPASGVAGSGEVEDFNCSSGGTCVVVGEYRDSGSGDVAWMIDTLVSGAWHSISVPVPSSGLSGTGTLDSGVSCAPDGSCAIAGSYKDGGGAWRRMMVILNGVSATSHQLPTVSNSTEDLGDGTPACSAHDRCIAIHYLLHGTEIRPSWIDSWDGAAWSMESPPVPAAGVGGPTLLQSPGCSATALCAMAIEYGDGDQRLYGLEVLHSGNWTATQMPVPANGLRDTGYVERPVPACTIGGACVIVGYYTERPPA